MKKLYGLAAVFALLTGVLFYGYLARLGQKNEVERDSVVVAAQEIGRLQTITPEMLKVVEVEKGSAHPASVSDPSLVEGMVTESEILKDEPIYPEKLKKLGDGEDGLAFAIPADMRAVTISVDQVSGLSGYLQTGDRVDLIATVNLSKPGADGTDKTIPTSGILAENLEILACGTRQPTEEGSALYETVTLAVTPEQAIQITQVATQGMLRAMLRNPQDDGVVDWKTVTDNQLFQ